MNGKLARFIVIYSAKYLGSDGEQLNFDSPRRTLAATKFSCDSQSDFRQVALPDENQIGGMEANTILKNLFQYFLQGLIILAPIAITIWTVTVLFTFVDSILPDLLNTLFPALFSRSNFNPFRIPGFGFILVLVTVILVGYISSSFIIGRLVLIFDKVLERTPGIKVIYSTVKDFFEAFAGNKRKFTKSVLVNIHSTDTWQIGFVTQHEVEQFGLTEYVAVYVPKSYAFAGQLYFVKKESVRLLTDVSSAEAMKFAISGGVTDIDEDHHVHEKTD